MTTKFSSEEDECLISLIKEHPEIYDKDLRAYRDFGLKAIVWKNIAANLGRTENDCKARWKNARDYYKKKRSDYIKERGAIASERFDPSFSTKLQNLSFLESICRRESLKTPLNDVPTEEQVGAIIDFGTLNLGNIDQKDILLEESMESFCNIKKEYDSNTELVETDYSINSELEIRSNEFSSEYGDHHKRKINKEANELRKRRKINNSISSKKIDTNSIHYKDLRNAEDKILVDRGTSLFFESIAVTVSELTPRLRTIAKMKVLEIVSKLQIQELNEKEKMPPSVFPEILIPGNDEDFQGVTDRIISKQSPHSSSSDGDEFTNEISM